MMGALTTFLDICNEFKHQVQIEGAPLGDTEGQEGMAGRVVQWCGDAQMYVEGTHPDWNWLRATKEFDTVAAKQQYTLDDLSLSTTLHLWDLEGKDGQWRPSNAIYKPGQSDGRPLTWLEYETWRQKYQQWDGSNQVPTQITEDDDHTLILYPTPNDIYPIQVPYFLYPVRMVTKTSTPGIPEHLRGIIVEWAKVFYQEYEDAPEMSFFSSAKYNELYFQLEGGYLRRNQHKLEGAGQTRHVKMRPFA